MALLGLHLPSASYLFLFSLLTGPRTLPKMRVQLFAKMDPTVEVCEGMSTLIMPWHPSLFNPK